MTAIIIDLQKLKGQNFKRRMYELAVENQKQMDGTTAPVKRIIAGADLVFAMWANPTAESGCDWMTVKGAKLLRQCVERNQSLDMRCGAVLVECAEMAMATCQTLGDNDDAGGLH